MFLFDMNIKEIRRKNLRKLIDDCISEGKYETQEQFAEAVGIDKTYLSQMLMMPNTKGARGVSEQKARQIELNLKLKNGHLDIGEAPIQNTVLDKGVLRPSQNAVSNINNDGAIEPMDNTEYVVVPIFDIRAACGDGYTNTAESLKGGVAFKESWIRSKGISPKLGASSIVYAQGYSMYPTIAPNNVLLLDQSQNSFESICSGDVYAFIVGSELRVKRLFKDIEGGLRVVSDNPDKAIYPDEYIKPAQLNQIIIAGHIKWRGGDL